MRSEKSLRCSHARKKGIRLEYELLNTLKKTYPSLAISFIKGEYHDIYDLYSPWCNFDNVSVDIKNRLICDHKNYCKKHIHYQKETHIPGFISFIWYDSYKFLPVDSPKMRRVKRPTIDGRLLSQCKPLPIDPYYMAPDRKTSTIYTELTLRDQNTNMHDYLDRFVSNITNVSTLTNHNEGNLINPGKADGPQEVIKRPLLKLKKHVKQYRDPIITRQRNMALFNG